MNAFPYYWRETASEYQHPLVSACGFAPKISTRFGRGSDGFFDFHRREHTACAS